MCDNDKRSWTFDEEYLVIEVTVNAGSAGLSTSEYNTCFTGKGWG